MMHAIIKDERVGIIPTLHYMTTHLHVGHVQNYYIL